MARYSFSRYGKVDTYLSLDIPANNNPDIKIHTIDYMSSPRVIEQQSKSDLSKPVLSKPNISPRIGTSQTLAATIHSTMLSMRGVNVSKCVWCNRDLTDADIVSVYNGPESEHSGKECHHDCNIKFTEVLADPNFVDLEASTKKAAPNKSTFSGWFGWLVGDS